MNQDRAFLLRRPALALSLCLCVAAGGCATAGSDMTDADRAAQKAIGEKVKGAVVWSSGRDGNHDLFMMDPDGSHVRKITKGENVDWFPRFSPDGSKILFTRSKKGWVYERDANSDGKWDIWTVTPDGKEETKRVDNASWGGWLSDKEIIYVRGTKIFRRPLDGGEETVVMDSNGVSELDGALLQQPEMSRDGKFLAITLRGSKRETGVWDIARKKWTKTGLGCQINWTPDGKRIYWVNPTGNGGSEVFSARMKGGKPEEVKSDDELKFMDLPGRQSHEYFPELSADGKWMVWGATKRGHDHDTADYDIFIWEVGAPPESATRLTFDTHNDRWPDIYVAGAGGASKATAQDGEGAAPAVAGGKSAPGEGGAAPAEEPAPAKATAGKAATKKKVHGKRKRRRR
jgi:Tol biopolymer transport system component